MNNRDAIIAAVELIETNLHEDLSVQVVAARSGLSLYYFSRLFRGVTGYSPKAYISARKLTESARELLETDKKIIELAFEYGYSSPELYARAFQRTFGCNPSECRKTGVLERSLLVPRFEAERIINPFLASQQPELVTLPRINLVGIPLFCDAATLTDLSGPWGNLIRMVPDIPQRVQPERFYQLQYWFEDQDPDTLYIFPALEVCAIDDMPLQLNAKVLPEARYLKFYHKGRANTVGRTYEYIYETFLPETDYRLPHLYNFELYGPQSTDPHDDESVSEIYIPVETDNRQS